MNFISHAGLPMTWKIECDAISPDEWNCLARMIRENEPQNWQKAVGIPRGGCPLGEALDEYSTGVSTDPVLIADDVYTTGMSQKVFKEEHYKDIATIQWVVFSREPTVGKVKALFTMPNRSKHKSLIPAIYE